ncbi:MAG: DNA polymerase III subunit beta [Endozoicomonadaceae bacterium]|nr:DNA polymerase III subunit beta [Endozoicomonadaceae bacterium]
MKLTINREALLKPLQLVAGVVERRQTLPVLSNILFVAEGNTLSLTGTDLEVELIARVKLEQPIDENGEITVPARKLMDICKSLPEDCTIELKVDDYKVIVRSGRSRFTLSTLPANDFPNIKEDKDSFTFSIAQSRLRCLIDRTGFAMAKQDVRYYLNGMLLEVNKHRLHSVATDGHRLAMCSVDADISQDNKHQVIIPRKGILELARLLTEGDKMVTITIGGSHIRANTDDFTFTSKLVDGKFPDYERVLPRGGNNIVIGDRITLRQAFNRTAILSNEKYRGVRMILSENNMKIMANNPEQEKAEEEVSVSYQGDNIEIGFNVSYLLDVLSVVDGDAVKFTLSDSSSSILIEDTEVNDSVYVVMPMCL